MSFSRCWATAFFLLGCSSSPGSSGSALDASVDGANSDASSSSDSGSDGAADASVSTDGGADGGSLGDAGDSGVGSDSGADAGGATVAVRPSAGCGKTGAPTGKLPGQKSTVAGVPRGYDLFVPNAYDESRPHVLVFTYHGAGGTANTNQFRFDTFSEAHGGASIEVAPQGWGTPEWDQNHFVPFNLDASVQLFDQVLDELAQNYCIDLNRVFAMGHSNGGQMAFHLGCLRGDKLRGIIPSSGRCFSYGQGVCDPAHSASSQQCKGEVMVLSVMGEDDTTRLADEAATVEGFRLRAGCSTQTEPRAPAPCQRFLGCADQAEVASCRIPGLAHAIWQDGRADLYDYMLSL